MDRALVRELGVLGSHRSRFPEEFGGLWCAEPHHPACRREAIGYADINVAYLQILPSLKWQHHFLSYASK